MTTLNNQYSTFVEGLLSKPTTDNQAFLDSIVSLQKDVNISTLLAGSLGLLGESAEVSELVKKMIFQGKPFTQDIKEKLVMELGDVAFYLMTACLALNVNIDDIILNNIEKLKTRYPNGFTVQHSENRIV
jgi:NTP pyrophosphatase (non-canonical NTP hydrolase)